MRIKLNIPLTLLAFLWLAGACSTQKNTTMSRAYHNLTAHYNVFFNGNESFKEGEAKVIAANKNDYSRILPMFEYSDPQNTAGVTAQMDRAIEKGVLLVAKHSITKKPQKKRKDGDQYYQAFYDQKEFNQWVDDAYLLIGKAHFYKHEFDIANQSFDLVIRNYPNTPSRYEALLWRAATYTEKGDYATAALSLNAYDALGNPPRSLYGLYMAIYADILMKQQKYTEAIPYLKGAVSGARKKQRKLRYAFILAQVYEETGRIAEAQEAYRAVRKMRPPYEMAFNANINRVSIVVPGMPTDDTKRAISKLLRDKRNLLYQDRIYFALANVNQIDGDTNQALANLKTSTKVSVNNDKQKAISFMRMGDIYYDMPRYKFAYQAYDSAMVYMPETDEEFTRVKDKHASLQQLVVHIDTRERQDSLQNLAIMSQDRRLAAIDKIIFDAAKKQEEEMARQEEMQYGGNVNDFYGQSLSSQQTGGKWYFYNLASIGMGKSEFERKWGRRKLEDNWRRANKMAVLQIEEAGPGEPPGLPDKDPMAKAIEGDPNVAAINNALEQPGKIPTREDLLKDIPLTPEAIAESNKQLEEALLGIAVICRDRLYDYPMAVSTLLEFMSRFPQSLRQEEALIELYRTYELMGNPEGLAQTKAQLVKQFPSGKFTAYLTDPEYVLKMQTIRAQQASAYEATYAAYLNGNHQQVIENAQNIETNEKENPLLAKYRLLKALAFAREAQLEPFKSNLETIKSQHPNTEEAEIAIAFLAELDKGRMPVKSTASSKLLSGETFAAGDKQKSDDEALQTFTIDAAAPHSVVVVLSPSTDIKRFRFNMADFNFGNYLVRDFEMMLHKLPDNSMLFEVKGFDKQSEAMEYFYNLRHHPEVFLVDGLANPLLMAIHEPNLKYVTSSGNLKAYLPFFMQVYLRSQSKVSTMDYADFEAAMGNLAPDVVNLEELEKQRQANQSVILTDGYTKATGEHWFAVVYNASGVNHVQLQNLYKGFIASKMADKNLTVTLVDLKPAKKILVVKGFANEEQANEFAQLAAKNPAINNPIRTKRPEPLVISPANFDYLTATGKIDDYKQFLKNK
jgi:hypothetical protein